ncbi:MAG: RES family NAD+ phosphorylase [Granulosicoccus sp.]
MEKSDSAIWQAIEKKVSPGLIGGTLHRLVESQEQVATARLVDGDLDKQALLEELLEPSKPPRVKGTEHLDYLLATPWRYPPLKYGSRFGQRYETSLFYGGLSEQTTLAEGGFYRWVFLLDMDESPSKLRSQHTMYNAQYRTEKGLRLNSPPFVEFDSELTHKSRYQDSQALGSAMRTAGIEAFEYASARDPAGGSNVALIEPVALISTSAKKQRAWLCTTSQQEVLFSYRGSPSVVKRFHIDDFMLDGRLPRPA